MVMGLMWQVTRYEETIDLYKILFGTHGEIKRKTEGPNVKNIMSKACLYKNVLRMRPAFSGLRKRVQRPALVCKA